MNILHDVVHRWGAGPADLSKVILTCDDKDWLACLVIDQKFKPKEVARHFSLNINSLRYFIYRKRTSSRNYSRRGRTQKIDETSDESIKNALSQVGERAVERLKTIIKEEARETFMRVHPNYECNDGRRSLYISHRSINRYYCHYLSYLSNLESLHEEDDDVLHFSSN
jgi:hypothetical protein